MRAAVVVWAKFPCTSDSLLFRRAAPRRYILMLQRNGWLLSRVTCGLSMRNEPLPPPLSPPETPKSSPPWQSPSPSRLEPTRIGGTPYAERRWPAPTVTTTTSTTSACTSACASACTSASASPGYARCPPLGRETASYFSIDRLSYSPFSEARALERRVSTSSVYSDVSAAGPDRGYRGSNCP